MAFQHPQRLRRVIPQNDRIKRRRRDRGRPTRRNAGIAQQPVEHRARVCGHPMNRQPELFGGAFRYRTVERKRIRDRRGSDGDGIVVRGRFDFSRDRDRVAIRNERHIRRLPGTAAVHVEFERVAVDRNRTHRRLKIFARIGGIPVRIDLRPEQRAGIDRNAALDAVNAERAQAPDARAQVARAQ